MGTASQMPLPPIRCNKARRFIVCRPITNLVDRWGENAANTVPITIGVGLAVFGIATTAWLYAATITGDEHKNDKMLALLVANVGAWLFVAMLFCALGIARRSQSLRNGNIKLNVGCLVAGTHMDYTFHRLRVFFHTELINMGLAAQFQVCEFRLVGDLALRHQVECNPFGSYSALLVNWPNIIGKCLSLFEDATQKRLRTRGIWGGWVGMNADAAMSYRNHLGENANFNANDLSGMTLEFYVTTDACRWRVHVPIGNGWPVQNQPDSEWNQLESPRQYSLGSPQIEQMY